jgi:two-component system, OmpR family, sensor histidine kinase KdpD
MTANPEEMRREPVMKPLFRKPLVAALPAHEFILAGVATLLLTAAAWLIEPVTGYQSIALLYLLLVVALSLRVNRGPVLAAAASSAVLWNFLFTEPRFTFKIDEFHDLMMFIMFFVVALSMGHLTSRLRRNEIAERQRERRTAALYELARQAAFADDLDNGLRAAVHLVESSFAAKAALLLREKDHTLSMTPHRASSLSLSGKEKSVAVGAFSERKSAGRFTDTMPDGEALHIPLQGRTAVMGVLSLQPTERKPFDADQRELLDAFAVMIGLVLEKDHIVQAFKRAEIVEASEQLRRAFLQSVSHELKTPLAAVQTGIDVLAKDISRGKRTHAALQEMKFAVRRLHRVINNLLNMTRIEADVIQPKLDWCDLTELIQAAIDLACENIGEYTIVFDVDANLPMVKVDQPLLEQCLCNLLLNSASNSAPGTQIIIRAGVAEKKLKLSVLDEGKGIRNEDLARIFEMFYRGSDAAPGGTGLGLAIVDGFVRAHGGTVRAVNRDSGGAEFVITIPAESFRPELMEASLE